MISIYYMENASICIQSFGTITTGMFKSHLKKYMYYLNKFCKYLKKKKERNVMYTYKEQIWNCF